MGQVQKKQWQNQLTLPVYCIIDEISYLESLLILVLMSKLLVNCVLTLSIVTVKY